MAPNTQTTASAPTIASQLRRRRGSLKSSINAKVIPPVDGQSSFFIGLAALVAAVVFIVSTTVGVAVLLTVTELGARLHVAGSLAAVGVIAQVRFTVPAKPFCDVIVTVAVLPVVAPGSIVIEPVAPVLPVNVGAEVTLSDTVVDPLSAPEVPFTVTVVVPVEAVLLAVSVRTLEPVAGFVAKAAVTPSGRPAAAKVTPPVNPPTPVTEMVLVPLAPWATDTEDGEDESVKPGAAFTVIETVVEAESAGALEVPVTVTVVVPVAAVLAAENVTWLEPLVGFVANTAVTPLGRPLAARVTLPLNPFAGVTVMVSATLLPCVTEREAVVGAIVKLGVTLTVRLMMVDAVSAPDFPVMVMVFVPVAAELPAVNVTTLEPVAGFGANAAVTPLGRPLAARVTEPLNPFAPLIVIVSAVLLPCVVVIEGAVGAIVKLGAMLTVRSMEVVAVSVKKVPVMAIVDVPVAAVPAAVSVSTLEPVVGLVAKLAVTPLGSPLAARVTPPVNPSTSVTVMVSVPLLP
jgi:hypothetical protein